MRAIGMALLVAAFACQQEEVKVYTVPVLREGPQPGDGTQPHRLATGLPNTAEDVNQLTPDEQTRFDQMVEGTSPIPECNELIRLLRTLSTCKKLLPHGRTIMQRSALMLGELGAHDTSKHLVLSCRMATANIVSVIKPGDC